MTDPSSIFTGFFAVVIVVVPNLLVCGYMLNRGVRHAVIPVKSLRNPVTIAREPGNERPLRTEGSYIENRTGTPSRDHCGQDAPCIGQWFIPADMCASCSANSMNSRPHRPVPATKPAPAFSFRMLWGETMSP